MVIKKEIIIYKNKILQDWRLLFFFVEYNKVCNIIIWKILSRNEGKYFAMEFYKMLLSNFNETL